MHKEDSTLADGTRELRKKTTVWGKERERESKVSNSVPRQKSTLCLDFNGTLRLVYLAAWEERRAQKVRKSRVKDRGERGAEREEGEREWERGPDRRSKANVEGRRTKRDCERGLDFYLYIYTSFMARPPFFALSFHLVTSLRLVTVRLASPRLALFSRLPLTAYGVDPFSNDAPGRSPRYPPAASVRVASLQASSNTLVLVRMNWTLEVTKRSGAIAARGWKRIGLFAIFSSPAVEAFRYDEDPWFSMKYLERAISSRSPSVYSARVVNSFKSLRVIPRLRWSVGKGSRSSVCYRFPREARIVCEEFDPKHLHPLAFLANFPGIVNLLFFLSRLFRTSRKTNYQVHMEI